MWKFLKNYFIKNNGSNQTTKQKKILIAAGGSGGHILPALTIAESLKDIDSNIQVECVHSFSDLEKEIYSRSDFVCHTFSIGRLRKNVSLKERLTTFLLLPFSFLKALWIILKSKPNMVFGTGGAVSGLILIAGWFLRKKIVIWEPNVIPGLANRWLARFADHIIIIFNETKNHFIKKHIDENKIIQMPYPVRSKITDIPRKKTLSMPLRVLVLGGSQGAFFINKSVSKTVLELSEQPFSFVHQTGHSQFSQIKNIYSDCKNVQVFSFLQDIHNFYEWSDVVISPAGAAAMAELSCIGRPGIIIPLENSADQHQLKNAQNLEQKSAIILIEQKALSAETLTTVLKKLSQDIDRIEELSNNIHNLKLGTGAEQTALKLLKYLS